MLDFLGTILTAGKGGGLTVVSDSEDEESTSKDVIQPHGCKVSQSKEEMMLDDEPEVLPKNTEQRLYTGDSLQQHKEHHGQSNYSECSTCKYLLSHYT